MQKKKADIWLRYDLVLAAKAKFHPDEISVTDVRAEVPLQNLNNKVKRLIELQAEVIEADLNIKSLNSIKATYILSWGFDGSSGHSIYNQSFESEEASVGSTDASLIATTLNPLRLCSPTGSIYWCNRTPQSVRFCTPIMLEY